MADLMKYLPPYYEDVQENIKLMNAENPEIDSLWDGITAVRDNQFILTSDDNRIRQWEKLLRIRPDYSQQSLDFRKAIVIMRLSTRLPLTYRWLTGKVAEIGGANNYIVKLIHDLYHLSVKLDYDEREYAKELYAYLREKVPANLSLNMEVTFVIESVLKICTKPYFNHTNDKVTVGGQAPDGEASYAMLTFQIMCPFKETINIGGRELNGAAAFNLFEHRFYTMKHKLIVSGSAPVGYTSGKYHYGHINTHYERLIIS